MIESRPILIAEDDVGMREGLSRSLRREGFTVTLAADGHQALDRLRERTYRMVITDLEMPRVKGIEVLREVKKRSPDVPVVVITAYGSIGTAVEAMKEGAFDFLTKPFSSDVLRDAVRRAWQSGNEEEARRLVPTGLIDKIGVVGTPEQCRAKLEEYREAGISLPIVSPRVSGPGAKESAMEIIRACAPR